MLVATSDDVFNGFDDRDIQILNRLRCRQMLGSVNVLDTDQAGEIRVFLVVCDGEFDQLTYCFFRFQILQMHGRFDPPDVAIGFFKDGDIQAFLAAKIIIYRAFGRPRTGRDGIHPGTAETMIGEFLGRDIKDILLGALRIVPARWHARLVLEHGFFSQHRFHFPRFCQNQCP